jgi:hypothetical protein
MPAEVSTNVERWTCRARRQGRGLTEVAEQRRHGGLSAVMTPPSGHRRQGRVPGDQREREHDEVRPFWLGEGEQQSSPKRGGGGGISAIFGEGRWNPTSGSGTWPQRSDGEG